MLIMLQVFRRIGRDSRSPGCRPALVAAVQTVRSAARKKKPDLWRLAGRLVRMQQFSLRLKK